MSEQISTILKRKLDDLGAFGGIDPETSVNTVKGELQYFVLNFIYHHTEYSKWIMYGGTALRIIHGLDRMSVDLDFEIAHEVGNDFLDTLKNEIANHFLNVYGAGSDFLTIKVTNGRGLTLKFCVGKLVAGFPSEWVHLTIDLNHFVAPKTVTEHRQINRGQFSFVIITYNMGALMASKIAAIFLRDQRGVGKNRYDYKGRDIYDLLWYMSKKAVPVFDYLHAKLKEKNIEMPDMKTLFNKLTIDLLNYEKMDNLLKDDLSYLFENQYQFEGWLKNWRESYLRLLDEYKINSIRSYQKVIVVEDLRTDIMWFKYIYGTKDGKTILVKYAVDDYLMRSKEGDVSIDIDTLINDTVEFTSTGVSSKPASQKKLKQYATVFYQKTERYFKKMNGVMLGDAIITKVIRMTADNLNQKEQIVLNESVLFSCELDDLLK